MCTLPKLPSGRQSISLLYILLWTKVSHSLLINMDHVDRFSLSYPCPFTYTLLYYPYTVSYLIPDDCNSNLNLIQLGSLVRPRQFIYSLHTFICSNCRLSFSSNPPTSFFFFTDFILLGRQSEPMYYDSCILDTYLYNSINYIILTLVCL